MRYFRAFVNSLLLLTIPSFAVSPQAEVPIIHIQTVPTETELLQPELQTDPVLSYDAILALIEEIEEGELEKRCNQKQLQNLNHLLVRLAREGILPNEDDEVLENDIQVLLQEEAGFDGYSFAVYEETGYMIAPNDNGQWEMILCKGWLDKQWDKAKKFVKKHKKELIIGAVIVVAAAVVVAVVVASSAAGAAAAGAAGAAGAAASSDSDKSESDKQEQKEESSPDPSVSSDTLPDITATDEASYLKTALDEQILSFKENIAREQFFQPNSLQQGLSWEENGRALGSLFAHESLENLNSQGSEYPKLSQEIQNMGLQYHFPIPGGNSSTPFDFGHPEIDRMFSTDYSFLYATSEKETDFNTLSYQLRGEKALSHGYYDQAIHDFGKVIELNPSSPLSYLERGVAYFGLGQYDRSLEDYYEFASQTEKTYSLSIPDFSMGFVKGVPKGIYDSGEGLFLFISNLVQHPVHTGEQMWDALTLLSNLARSEQWSVLSEVLAPEVHQLVHEWDVLPSDVRGEMAGYAFGKYGSDILIPGALAKVTSRGLQGAQELSAVYRGLKTAEKTFLLESVAELGNGAKIAEVIKLEKQISGWLGEGAQSIYNKAGDPVFLSKDGLRRIRFDFKNPHGDKLHLHIEEKLHGKWRDASSKHRIYPING